MVIICIFMSIITVETFEQGGAILWLLVAVSIFTVANIVFIIIRFRQAGLFKPPPAPTFSFEQQQKDRQKGKSTQVTHRLDTCIRSSWSSNTTLSQFKEEIVHAARLLIDDLRLGFRSLEVISATAPLLGLLGTVMGMIEAFKQLAAAGNQVDPSMLSAGIWQALLTTAGGLIVAIPALVAWHWFDRKLEKTRVHLNSVLLAATREFESEFSAR